jgi:hypothetical protein
MAGYSTYTTLVTSQFGERVTHHVLDRHAFDVTDQLLTVCGRLIVPAPMVAPLGKPCPACVALVPGAAARGRERRWRILRRG